MFLLSNACCLRIQHFQSGINACFLKILNTVLSVMEVLVCVKDKDNLMPGPGRPTAFTKTCPARSVSCNVTIACFQSIMLFPNVNKQQLHYFAIVFFEWCFLCLSNKHLPEILINQSFPLFKQSIPLRTNSHLQRCLAKKAHKCIYYYSGLLFFSFFPHNFFFFSLIKLIPVKPFVYLD